MDVLGNPSLHQAHVVAVIEETGFAPVKSAALHGDGVVRRLITAPILRIGLYAPSVLNAVTAAAVKSSPMVFLNVLL
jgi:hypothetical protein